MVRDNQDPIPGSVDYEYYEGLNANENNILEAVKLLNINFSSNNIYFKYTGYDIIRNSFLNGTTGTPTSLSNFGPFFVENSMNVFIAEYIGGSSGLAFLGNSHVRMTYQAMNTTFEKTLIHEIGHCFSLYHIFQNSNSIYCEHVTRIPTDPNYNALTEGDLVHDTPAQGVIGNSEFDINCNYVSNPNYSDCQGTPYENILPDNFMGYDTDNNCGLHFTEGQFQKMRNYLAQPNSSLSNQNVFNSINSFYEPFYIGGGTSSGSTITAYSKTMTPNSNNTGVDVWNCGPFKLRYQPGLYYEFENLPETVFVDYDEQFDAITNSSFIKVKIPVFDRKSKNVFTPVCFGSFEPYVSGDIKSLTNLGTANYTIEELDQIKATNPDLYNQLQSGQYHIITKETESGYVDQKMIYKN